MLRQSLMIIKGYIIWLQLRVKEHLDDKKFVLIVTEENEKVDQYALKYLDYVMERKYTKEALVIVSNQGTAKKVSKYHYKHQIKIKIMPFQKIKLLYKWYCMDGRRKNVVFTFVKTNKDNLLEHFINETDINEEDVVCLALYNLREIPKK